MEIVVDLFEKRGIKYCKLKYPKNQNEWELVIKFLKRDISVVYEKNEIVYFMDKNWKGEFYNKTVKEDILNLLNSFIDQHQTDEVGDSGKRTES